jgi:tetratricopeptide (TPR) repeat protein
MAKKKSKLPKRILKRPSQSSPPAESFPRLPDRRAMEGVMRKFVGGLGGRREETSLDQAQELMYQAFEAQDPERRVELARQALELSPDCADGYVLLAEHAPSREAALELLEDGVEAGERALGPEPFQEDVGHFWGILETRPYMRARQGLAEVLWASGRRDEAVQHLQDMLRLNPNDNQGVRHILAGWLLALDRDDDLARLLDEYDEESAIWAYSKALLAFRRTGDTPEARRLLKEAKKNNQHIPAFLLGERILPRHLPDYYSPGDPNEAILYVVHGSEGWTATRGALAWLRGTEKGMHG